MKNIKFNFFGLLLTTLLFFNVSEVKSDSYLYGGPKIFYYDVTQDDVDDTAADLVALGFSSAEVTANNSGVGFDIGFGHSVSDNTDLELGFVYMGEFELTATMTGPTEKLTATSQAYSFPFGAKYKLGDSDANIYLKGGLHYWRQISEISTSLGAVDMWGTGLNPMFGVGGQLGNIMVHYEHYMFSGVGTGAGIAGDGGISSIGITYVSQF